MIYSKIQKGADGMNAMWIGVEISYWVGLIGGLLIIIGFLFGIYWREQQKYRIKREVMGHDRLPLKVIVGTIQVQPSHGPITEISTANWPHGKNSFYLKLRGWHKKPPYTVDGFQLLIEADGNVVKEEFRALTMFERVEALIFVWENWPETIIENPQEV
jgi:hypothetical protein